MPQQKPARRRARPASKRTKPSRVHTVAFRPPELELENSDLRIEAFDTERKVGTLLISRGGVVWKGFNSPKKETWSWTRFDAIMHEAAAARRRRRSGRA